jgi:hypothetical protein
MALPDATSGFRHWINRLFEDNMFRIFVALVLLDWVYARCKVVTLWFVDGIKSVMGG